MMGELYLTPPPIEVGQLLLVVVMAANGNHKIEGRRIPGGTPRDILFNHLPISGRRHRQALPCSSGACESQISILPRLPIDGALIRSRL